ncbi:MAG: hypothetical protein MUE82_11240, partial [Chloroflexi bacterium]|nr:hypothetical protein [Chloroflexota bacterium]
MTLLRSHPVPDPEPSVPTDGRIPAVVAAVVALALASLPGAAVAAPSSSGSLAVGGLARTYRVHVPAALRPDARPALVLVLHGHGGSGAQAERAYGFDALADREGFVVAYPDGIAGGWNDAEMDRHADVDDVAFLGALLDELVARHAV